jgi:ectoine hydroxylase-related dioxygenase (phytanoyl-CoA dioxygenase family)
MTSKDQNIENVARLGYTVIEGVLTSSEAQELCLRLGRLYAQQVEEFGETRLRELNDYEIHRGPLANDPAFADLVIHPIVLELVDTVLGSTAILHLQNASAVAPRAVHFQSRFHRDFAKDFLASKCLALNAFWCLTDFTAENGATWVVPGSHRDANLPSADFIERNSVQVIAPAGSIIFWDGLLLHKAGYNSSDRVRYGINHMYTKPFIKQQLDYPAFLKDKYSHEGRLGQVLGFWAVPPKSVKEYRVDPDKRTYRKNQG